MRTRPPELLRICAREGGDYRAALAGLDPTSVALGPLSPLWDLLHNLKGSLAMMGQNELAQAVAAYDQVGGNIVVVEPVPDSETHKYGIVALDQREGRLNRMTAMVEKPKQGTAPSNLIISGRYILQPEIFPLLERQGKGAGGEIQLTDSMLELMKGQDFHALEYDGTTFDCGDKIGLLRANVAFALQRPEFADAARKAIGDLL